MTLQGGKNGNIFICKKVGARTPKELGREPWSSGYGRWLMIERLWVWIPAPYTGWNWHFFTLICYKNCIDVCLKRPKINEKEAGVGPFFKKRTSKEINWFRRKIRFSVDPNFHRKINLSKMHLSSFAVSDSAYSPRLWNMSSFCFIIIFAKFGCFDR